MKSFTRYKTTVKDSFEDADMLSANAQVPIIETVRQFFPETWLWDNFKLE